jgi:hypothetical protein
MLALELTSVPEGSKVVAVAVIGIADVISPPDITGIICVEPLCTIVAVITEGPKSDGVVELVALAVPEVVLEVLLLDFISLVEFWALLEEIDDAEALDELNNELDGIVAGLDKDLEEDDTFADVLGVDLMKVPEVVELRFWVVTMVLDKVKFRELIEEVGADEVLLLLLVPDDVVFEK